jgi:TetR/AcrR family transcriptional repressor of nem operon
MTAKQPDQTRWTILEVALWEFYWNGFQRASIDRILEGTGLTKGALYHHFPNKLQLGYAVVDEIIGAWIHERWVAPLAEYEDPVEGLQETFRHVLQEMPEEMIIGGCPLNNLVQEMSGIDEGFRVRLEQVLKRWESGIADELSRGQAAGTVRTDLDASATASYLVSALEGMAGTAKATRGRDGLRQLADVFVAMVDMLRPAHQVSKELVTS